MIRKTKFGIIRAILLQSRPMNLLLDKRDKRLGYIIQSHHFFIWSSEEEFENYITLCLRRLLPAKCRQPVHKPFERGAAFV
jgi:hypothetical protein